MRNPYGDEMAEQPEIAISRHWCAVLAVLFLAGISVPSVWRHAGEWQKADDERWLPVRELFRHPSPEAANLLREKRARRDTITRETPSLRDHLQAFEDRIEDTELRRASRRADQQWLTRRLGVGNRRVLAARDGWLYLRPSVEALTGYGPLRPEPEGVIRDPDLPPWRNGADAVVSFARQLEERGIRLTLVPVPVKVMIHPHPVNGCGEPVVHPDYLSLLVRFRENGVETIDLVPLLDEVNRTDPAFLRQDTHWTPVAMEKAAAHVAARIGRRPGGLEVNRVFLAGQSRGDLVGMLDLPRPEAIFPEEKTTLTRLLDRRTGRPLESDPDSPVVLLGDSFVNIYEDPGLGFGQAAGEEGASRIGAGFASHLAAALGLRLHVIAINGEGATGVRREFAALSAESLERKEHVIWVIASRDLLYSATSGRKAGVVWRDVTFSPGQARGDETPGNEALLIEATMREKSAIRDPAETDYADALYSAIFDELEVVSGAYEADRVRVFLPAFTDRELLPSSRYEPGARLRLQLVPLDDDAGASSLSRMDDFFAPGLVPMLARQAEPVE